MTGVAIGVLLAAWIALELRPYVRWWGPAASVCPSCQRGFPRSCGDHA